jgi:hypothetical protein
MRSRDTTRHSCSRARPVYVPSPQTVAAQRLMRLNMGFLLLMKYRITSHMIFAILMRLELDGAGLGIGIDFGESLVSATNCTRFTGLCAVG